MEQVAGLVAPAGLVVTEQLRVTAPVKPLVGVTLIVEVLPVVAPAATLIAPALLRENVEIGLTVTLTGVVAVILPVAASVPVTVTAYAPVVVVEVVETASAAVAAVAPPMATEVGREHVAGLVAPAGLVVTAQVRLTVPIKPPDGVTLIVEVLPVVAPATIVRELLFAESANVLEVTVTETELLVADAYVASPL
jgi:hypothetical protein